MRIISKERLHHLREKYPVGCRVELLRMDDIQAPVIGTKGTVIGVDDIGSIMVSWDTGSNYLLFMEKTFAGGLTMTDKIKEQIIVIRDTGLTNMFDVNAVQRIADEMEFYELVIFLEEEKAKYVKFILNGDED